MSDEPRSSDEDLVRRVRAGDEAAARELFDRHLPALRAKARARLPDSLRGKVGPSDVVQDAWLAAFLALGDFEDRGDGSFGRWLRGIVAHRIADEIDRHVEADKRDVRREQRVRTGSVDVFGAVPDQTSPSQAAVADEERRVLSDALAALPEDYAAVLRHVHVEGLTLVETGARMGRSADAVRKLYRRATVAMAARLRDIRPTGA
jgi:RNA polymerase sigma-70 factor (ECF subfamily)